MRLEICFDQLEEMRKGGAQAGASLLLLPVQPTLLPARMRATKQRQMPGLGSRVFTPEETPLQQAFHAGSRHEVVEPVIQLPGGDVLYFIGHTSEQLLQLEQAVVWTPGPFMPAAAVRAEVEVRRPPRLICWDRTYASERDYFLGMSWMASAHSFPFSSSPRASHLRKEDIKDHLDFTNPVLAVLEVSWTVKNRNTTHEQDGIHA